MTSFATMVDDQAQLKAPLAFEPNRHAVAHAADAEHRRRAFLREVDFHRLTSRGCDHEQEPRRRWMPENPMFVFVNDGAVDPSRVPSGRSMMRILVQPLPFEMEGDATGVVPQRSWEGARDPYADYVVSKVERNFIPGLGRRILKRTVHDPLTMSIESPDCIRGGVTFGMPTPEQSGAMRPIPELGQYRTPVSSLYLCGSGSHPGAGVSMAPGRNAAMTICEALSSV